MRHNEKDVFTCVIIAPRRLPSVASRPRTWTAVVNLLTRPPVYKSPLSLGLSEVFTLPLGVEGERKRYVLGRLEGIKRSVVTGGRRWRRRGGVERKMEREKDNYRECWSMQEGDRVGDMLVVMVLGGGKKDSKQWQRPPLLLRLHSVCVLFNPSSQLKPPDPSSPSLPILSLQRPRRHHSISWR